MKTLLVSLLVLFPLLPACHSDQAAVGQGREPDEYIGCAADEDWPIFDAVPDVVSDSEAPRITAPVVSASPLPSTPADFVWSTSAGIAGSATGDVAMDCEQWNVGYTTLHLAPIS